MKTAILTLGIMFLTIGLPFSIFKFHMARKVEGLSRMIEECIKWAFRSTVCIYLGSALIIIYLSFKY